MGINVSRFVRIQISNKTRNITLENPRIHFFSGHVLESPQKKVSPGSTESCHFTNNTFFWGCHGLLVYEAESFTLAICFANHIDYNRALPEMCLELSMDKVHHQDLKVTYDRLASSFRYPSQNTSVPHQATLREGEEQAQVCNGPVQVTATMNRGRSAVIKVVVEDRGGSGQEAEIEAPSPGKHVQEEREPVEPPGAPHGQP